MRELKDCSGPWVGFWIQGSQRGSMRLTLRFWDETVEGEGDDFIGDFTIRGEYSAVMNEVSFTKTYPTHLVLYKGSWDGAMISGEWEFSRRMRFVVPRGGFEIWPEREEESIERQLEVESKPDLQPVGA
ncbi:hypothetical protein EON82_01480 [bacterium]|nr:MAG: hypothetical protein EON82_01480 [bacterium]